MHRRRSILPDILVLLVCGIIPVLVAQWNGAKPGHRYIHIDSFRYGKDPATVHCNRGDTLHLTFSSRDTGHSFFLQEFDMDVKVRPSDRTVLQFHAGNPELPPVSKDTVVFVAEHPGLMKFLVSKSIFRCHVYCGPMHAFEQGNLVIGPNTLLHCGLGMLFGLCFVGMRRLRSSRIAGAPAFVLQGGDEGKDLLQRFPRIRQILKQSWLQPAFMLFGGVVLYIVLLTTLFGTAVSGRNLGIMLVWTVWLFLLISVLTPFGGRLWCMMCPLPTCGEWLQRRSITRVRSGSTNGYRNQFFGLQRTWPKFLSNGWPRVITFLIAGTLSTTFVAQPRTTGFAILTVVVMATVLAVIYKLRSFCQFLCPINAFIATYSQLGKLALRKSSQAVCASCKGDFCEKGSHTGWACPYGLNVRTITSNVDCGLCTECLRSCTYDNVTFKWKPFGSEAETKDVSLAWSAIAMLAVGIAYTVVYLGPWSEIRDYGNIIDRSNWGLFAVYALALWSGALLILPLLLFTVTTMSQWVSGAVQRPWELMIASTEALLPLGLFVWIAFILQMLFVNVTFLEQSFNDPFGWGWNLFGLSGIPWVQFVPRGVPWLQVALVLAGVGYSLRTLWRVWITATRDYRMALKGMVPLALLLLAIGGTLIWFYAD